MSAAFDAFLEQAWAEHADRPDVVADRLRTDTPAPATAGQLIALSRFVVHLCGEHLGAYDDGRWRLAALATHPLADATAQSALRVGRASLTLAERGCADIAGLTVEERVACEACGAAICIGQRQTARALALLAAARERLDAQAVTGTAVHRPLAVACNNMAWELHDRGGQRSADDTAAMLDIAAASRLHWAQAGTWLEVERADCTLACCQLAAGNAGQALQHAVQCLAGCTQNDAPAYERFFAHEALARAHHALGDGDARARNVAAADAAFAQLDAGGQNACRPALDLLRSPGR